MNPVASARLLRGFDQLAEALAVTLGPNRGGVLMQSERGSVPVRLESAAAIARRVIALPDRAEDVGAMILRNMVWRVHQNVGDGGATTAVLAQAIAAKAARYIAAGANPVLVKGGILAAGQAVGAALTASARPVQGEGDLIAVARAVTDHEQLSLLLGEIFDLLGPHGHVTVEKYAARYLERVYLNGGRWRAQLASPYMVTAAPLKKAVLIKCRVALFGGTVEAVDEVRPLLELLAAQENARVLIVAYGFKGDALNALVSIHATGKIKIAAAALRRDVNQRRNDLADLALLTRAAVFSTEAGRPLAEITLEDLGSAQRIEAGREDLVVVGGTGQRAEIRAQIEVLNNRLLALAPNDQARQEVQLRLGRFTGNTAVLKVGAATQTERDALHQKAEQGLLAVQVALEEGVVPGGGLAFIECRSALRDLAFSGDEQLGVQAVAHALEAPFRRILANAHMDAAGIILADLLHAGPGHVYDVLRQTIVAPASVGLFDPARVARVALETAASGAAIAISTDTLILHSEPEIAQNP